MLGCLSKVRKQAISDVSFRMKVACCVAREIPVVGRDSPRNDPQIDPETILISLHVDAELIPI